MNSLAEWLRTQYGPGKEYPSARQLSFELSNGKNPNLIFDIERRGYAKFETLVKLAELANLPVTRLFVLAGYIPQAELNLKLSVPEQMLVDNWNALGDEDQNTICEVMVRFLRTGGGRVPSSEGSS